MKRLISRVWPDLYKSQGSAKPRESILCDDNFFASVIWLSPQFCYFPC
jgi:hypothetical protein